MANQSVLELAVGTGKWDAGLKKAKSALDNFTQSNGGLQQALDKESQKMQQFVRMMGSMESTAKTAKGQMNDYKSTIEQLTMQYNRMSEAQKKTIGQDYLQAIDQMKQKYQSVNEEIQEMNRSLKNIEMPEMKGGGLFSGMGDKMSGALQVFAGNMLTKGVTTLTSELAGSVQESLKLAREGEGIRIAFARLNQPGLLDNLKEATHGTVSEIDLMKQAIQFSNFKLPLEDLATYLAFAQQKAKDTGQSIDDMVNSIVTGLGRQSIQILDNLGISATEIRNRMKEGGDMTQVVADIIREEMAKAGDYVETAAERAARATAKAKDEMEAMGRKALPIADEVSEMWNTIRNGGIKLINTVLTPIANSLKDIQNILRGGASFDVRIPDNVGSNIDDNGNFIKKPSNGNWAGFNAQTGQYNDAITSIADIVVTGNAPKRKTGRGGGGRSVSGKTEPTYAADSIAAQEKLVQDLNKAWREAGSGVRDSYLPQIVEAEAKLKTMKDEQTLLKEQAAGRLKGSPDGQGLEIPLTSDVAFDEWMGGVVEKLENLEIDPIKIPIETTTKDVKSIAVAARMTADVVGSIGDAFNAIEDPAAKVMGTVMQAIASVALGYAQATAQAGSMGPWVWLAFAASGLATMIATISTIHSQTGYAEGGMIKGNSYSGDNIGGMVDGSQFVGLNAGEVVLNAAQQSSLAQQLEGGGMQNLRLEGVVTGENIKIALNRHLRRIGEGEIVTW